MANKKHDLLNELKPSLSNTLGGLKHNEFQGVNSKAVDTLAEAIPNNYYSSFLRITNYIQTRILYFYPVENPMITFSRSDEYQIFSSALADEDANIKNVNEVRATLIAEIERIKNQHINELKSYNESLSMKGLLYSTDC
jgi:transcription antitermination factor NusG